MINVHEFVRKDSLVFDIGANIGSKVELYLSKGVAKVVAVEPIPHCVAKMEIKFKGNDKVVIIQKGLADKSGILKLSVCSSDDVLSTFTQHWKQGRFRTYNWDKEIDVDVVTLDSLVEKYGKPSFCKVDVEGFEQSVIKGLSKNSIKCISFEFASEFVNTETKACIEHLKKIGYTKFNIGIAIEENMHSPKWIGGNQIMTVMNNLLKNHPYKMSMWGDVYATF